MTGTGVVPASNFTLASGDVIRIGIRHNLGEFNFSGRYQQESAPLGGGMVQLDRFKI